MKVTPEDLNTGRWRLKYYLARVKKTTTPTNYAAVDRVWIRTGCIPLGALPLKTS